MIHELLWRITYRCNRNCPFCFNRVFEDKVDFEKAEINDLDRVLNFVERHGIEKVYISGGEPTLVKQLPDAIGAVANLAKVTVFTNGSFLKAYSPREIAGMHISAINVSIDQNDILNSTPWLSALLENARKVKMLEPQIRINTQLMIDRNYFSVTQHPGFSAVQDTLDRVFWQPLTVPKGNALYSSTLEGMPANLADEILVHVEKSNNREMESHAGFIRQVLKGKPGDTICHMGHAYITLNPDLSVSLCPHDNRTSIPLDQFEEIHTDMRCDKLSMRCVCLYSHLKRRYPQYD